MNDDVLGLKSLSQNLVVVSVVVIGIGLIFHQEATEALQDWITPKRAAQYTLASGELSVIRGFTLAPQHNDIKYVNVTNLQASAATPAGTPIMFQLTNNGDSNDYPNIKVVLQNVAGATLRELTFTPADYPHSGGFEKVQIKFMLKLVPGEAKFEVHPFYPDARS